MATDIFEHSNAFDVEALNRDGEFDEIISEDEWLFTYSDMITLLLTFFVMIISISEVSQTKIEILREAMTESLLLSENVEATPFKKLQENLDKVVENLKLNNQIEISKKNEGVYIELKDKVLYQLGSAELQPQAQEVLDEVIALVKEMNIKNLLIEVSGHTDNLPIKSKKYPSNWELSAHRATNVVKYFISKGVNPRSLKPVGYADSRPKRIDPNGDLSARELRDSNRRIVIGIIRPML